VKITLQYFDGCPHWKLAERRLADVLQGLDTDKFTLEYERIESPEMAERVGFRGSPTILIDGSDPFATGEEPIGMSCRVFRTEHGAQGAPTKTQLRDVLEVKGRG
jgi:glutaredoxin